MNITAVQLRWRDTAVLVEGHGVTAFLDAFEMHWDKRRRIKRALSRWVRVNSTLRQRRKNYWSFISMILHAQRRVWITNAYFVPDGSLLHALRFAAISNVDVRVLFSRPAVMSPRIMAWIMPAYYATLIRAGIRVFEYQPTFIHAKTALVDDLGIVGSSNLNHRSLIHDLEIDVHLTRPRSIEDLAEHFKRDLSQSREVTLASLRKISVFRRLVSRLLLVFRYFL